MSMATKPVIDKLPTDTQFIYTRRGYARRFSQPVAVLLSKIHWHCQATTTGKDARIMYKGKAFIVKTQADWAHDCGLTQHQVILAFSQLRKLGIIHTENHLIKGGAKVMHLQYLLVQDDEYTDDKEFFDTLQGRLDSAVAATHNPAYIGITVY